MSDGGASEPGESATISLAPGPAMGPVLGRVVWMLAARADLPIDRLDDAVLVADAISMHAPEQLLGERLSVRVEARKRTLRLVAGPLREGGGQSLIESSRLPAVGSVLDRLADEMTVVPGPDGGEQLDLTLRFDG